MEMDVMAKNKSTTAKLHAGVRSSREDRPPIRSAEGARKFGHQGAAFATDVSEKAEVTAETTAKVLGQTNSTVTGGASDFNRQLIEIVRANSNATLDFVHQLVGVKSPAEFIELSAAHARRQFETFAEQSKNLSSLAQKVTAHSVEPLRMGMTSVLLSNAA